jgi:hypothetical protein
MRNGLHIYDFGVERYVDQLREAEKARLIKKAKKAKKPFFRNLRLLSQLHRSA